MTSIFRPETKVKVDQLVTTGTPSSNSFLAGDGSYQEITIDPYDVVGGRLDLVSATSIKWGFQDSAQIRLWDGEKWANTNNLNISICLDKMLGELKVEAI